jgi:hypothetical protein
LRATGSDWRRAALAAAALYAAVAPASAGVIKNPGPEIGPTEILGPLIGPGATPVPPGLLLYGTDLGWTFEHQGELEILFGDTWIVSNSLCLGEPANDDSAGVLPAAPPLFGAPDVDFHTKPAAPNQFAPIEIHRGADSLAMGYGRVPLTGFSDSVDAAALFGRGEIVRCTPKGGKQTCRAPKAAAGEPLQAPKRGLVCATDLGACMPGGVAPCDLGSGAGCGFGQTCEPAEIGFCIDETSSQIAAPEDRRFAVAHANEVGIRRAAEPTVYDSVAIWRTNKFRNATARGVARFRTRGEGSDWSPGTDALLVWGRPGFTGEEGREAQLYLAAVELPLRTGEAGKVRFRPRYFAGVGANGRPRWTRSEAKAAPLSQDGVAGGSPHEVLPQPLQMGIGWVGAPLSKWVMLYGGDLADYLLADPANATPAPAPGAVRIRFADAPWGPWSVGQPILAPGDPGTVGDPYGPGGVLYHSECADAGPNVCAASDPTRPLHILNPGCTPFPIELDHGGFYGANLIDAYTGPDGEGGVELVWNISTWNPYGVLFLRTRVAP